MKRIQNLRIDYSGKSLDTNKLNKNPIEEFKKCKKTPLVIVLDNIRSALNVGSIFRTSDAFLIDKIMLCGITACPPQKDIRKSALGADTSVKWEYYSNTCLLYTSDAADE